MAKPYSNSNDDQGGPPRPPGLCMAEALGEGLALSGQEREQVTSGGKRTGFSWRWGRR
jgi:hypothetical protein